jgi:hypothetical protein
VNISPFDKYDRLCFIRVASSSTTYRLQKPGTLSDELNCDGSKPCFCVLCRTCTVKSCTVCQCDRCGRLKSDISSGSSSLCVGCHQLDQTICTMTCQCPICHQINREFCTSKDCVCLQCNLINQMLCSSIKCRCPQCW